MRIIKKKYPKGIKVVGLILSKERDKIILIERYKEGRHYFVFPGGGIEDFDKNKKEALRREILEETNVKIKILTQPYELRIKGHTKQLFYICEYFSGALQLIGEELLKQSEKDRYLPAWFEFSNILSQNVYPLEVRDWLVEDLRNSKWQKRVLKLDSFDKLKN